MSRGQVTQAKLNILTALTLAVAIVFGLAGVFVHRCAICAHARRGDPLTC